MDKNSVSISFSAYNFLRLYCAILVINDEDPIIDNHELEKLLYKYHNNLEFKILFEDIVKREDSINSRESYLDLSEAFQTSYAFGLLSTLQNNDALKSIINLSKMEAETIIKEYDNMYVEQMTNIAYQLNCNKNINNMKKSELSNFQKALKQLNAPYKKNKAYEIFVENTKNHSMPNNNSMFWNTDIGYVPKYKNVNMNMHEKGSVKKKIK